MASTIEPRLRQIFLPLMSVIEDPNVRQDIAALASEYQEDITADRGMEPEALVLESIQELFTVERKSVSIKEVTEAFKKRCGDEYKEHVSNRWIARIVRKKLKLRTYKSYGVFVIPFSETPKLRHLYGQYGIAEVGSEVGG